MRIKLHNSNFMGGNENHTVGYHISHFGEIL